MTNAWIDWEAFTVKTDAGTVLSALTMKKLQLDLEQYFWSLRTGMEISMSIEWSSFIRDAGDKAKTAGKDDPKKIISLAEKDLLHWIELRAQAEAHLQRFPKALHKVFEEAEIDAIERNTVVSYVLQALGVKIKDAEATRIQLLEYLKNNETAFMSQGRPTVTLYRTKNEKGVDTGVHVPHPAQIAADKTGRQLPKYSEYRWTSKFVEAGISSRAQFDEMLEWINRREGKMRKPTVQDCAKFVVAAVKAHEEEVEEDEEVEEEEVEETTPADPATWGEVVEASAKKNVKSPAVGMKGKHSVS